MPHKRAKRITRQLEQEKRGTDLPPIGNTSTAQESIPKSLTRVLQAETVRKIYREKRMRIDDNDDERAAKRRRRDTGVNTKIEIKHGESLAHFNRRVEDDMRAPVAEAMHASRNHAKRTKKAEAKATAVNSLPSESAINKTGVSSESAPRRKTEFDVKPSIKRLNDIVHAPPNFTKLPRGAGMTMGKTHVVTGRTDSVVSMAQMRLMTEERDRAIRRYRELKEAREYRPPRQ